MCYQTSPILNVMKYSYFLIFVFFCLAFRPLNYPPSIQELVKEDLEYLVDFYKKRHQQPELSLEEKETAKALATELQKIGFEVTENFGGYGIVGIFKNGAGPRILYRTDMDALPMSEKTELPYASQKTVEYNGQTVGAMHSCGHDVHMTTWLGTARAMVNMKNQWKGTLMLIGQPAEELGKGAKMMLDKGLYETFGVPDYALGLHSSPTIPAGQIGIREGYTMATVENVDIQVYGVGAHGASPHQAVDPVVIASMIVMDLQTIVSRSLKPIESAVVTVGAIEGGTKHNIIPDEVNLKLTVRTYKKEVRELVHQRIQEICKGMAIAAGLPEDKMPKVTISDTFVPSNYNTPAMVQTIMASAKKVIGTDNVVDAEPQMVGEDYAHYGQTKHKVPSALYWLGTVPKERIESGETLPGLHSPYYYPNAAKSIETGILVNVEVMLDLMK